MFRQRLGRQGLASYASGVEDSLKGGDLKHAVVPVLNGTPSYAETDTLNCMLEHTSFQC